MKKFLMMMALMLSLVLSINAQTAIETPKFLDNVYVGVEAGATTPLNFVQPFKNVNPVAGVVLGKDLTPVFGVQAEGMTWFQDHNFANSHTAFKAINVGLNGTINLSNLFFGYKGTPRAFEVTTVTGLGWLRILSDHGLDGTPSNVNGVITAVEDNDELTAKTGLNLAFNLGAKKQHQIYLQPAVMWNLTGYTNRDLTGYTNRDDVQFNKNHAQFAVMLGYTYKFKTSNGTHNFKTYDVGAMNNEINRLQAELAKKPNVVVREIIKEKVVAAENTVWIPFAFDKAELTNDAKAILDNLKDVKAVNVDGYASWEDGSNAEHNTALSIVRAHTVTEYLKSIGVNVNKSEGHGAEGITSQRCVIVSVVK